MELLPPCPLQKTANNPWSRDQNSEFPSTSPRPWTHIPTKTECYWYMHKCTSPLLAYYRRLKVAHYHEGQRGSSLRLLPACMKPVRAAVLFPLGFQGITAFPPSSFAEHHGRMGIWKTPHSTICNCACITVTLQKEVCQWTSCLKQTLVGTQPALWWYK